MFFRVDTIGVVKKVLTSILFRFHIRSFTCILWIHGYSVSRSDIAIIFIGMEAFAVVDVLNERAVSVREQLKKCTLH